MMYNNKMIAVVKVGGKILREVGDTVYIPFGSEYSIHFANHNGVAAVVGVSIDGEDVLDGDEMVVRSGKEGYVEGFLKDGKVSHKFKFIEKTEQISEHRGDRISDGIVRVAYRFEKPKVVSAFHDCSAYGGSNFPNYPPGVRSKGGGTGNPTFGSGMQLNSLRSSTYDSHPNSRGVSVPEQNDSGITVNGSASNQSFQTTSIGPLETQEFTIVFQLKGETDNGFVPEPILVRTKLICDTCGNSNKSSSKFCSNCGTSLVI